MIKRAELADPNSCLNKAKDDENLFVLIERDPTFESVISFWIGERIRLGLNKEEDIKIQSARHLVRYVSERRDNASNR